MNRLHTVSQKYWKSVPPKPWKRIQETMLLDTYCLGATVSLDQVLELTRGRVHTELVALTEGVLDGGLGTHPAVDHAIQQRAATKPIVAMHAASDLTCRIETRDDTVLSLHLSIWTNFQASHAVVNRWRDDRNMERLSRHFVTWQDVVVKLFAAACWATASIP